MNYLNNSLKWILFKSDRFQHPNQISLVCLGPLTNIAMAVKVYPEIKDKIKEVFIMGGSYTGKIL